MGKQKKRGDERKSSRKQRYLLRLGVAKLIMSNIRRTKLGKIIYKHEPLVRKMPGKIHIVNWNRTRTGKSKPIPPKWTYIEALPAAGGMRDNHTHYTNLQNFLYSMKGNNTIDTRMSCAGPQKIRTPVYAPNYTRKTMKHVDMAADAESTDVNSPPIYKEPEYFEEDPEDITAEEDMDKFSDEETKES